MAPDAGAVRALVAGKGSISEDVARIVEDVRTGGDAALARYVERFDATGGAPPRVSGEGRSAYCSSWAPWPSS